MMAACAREDKSENADANDRADPTDPVLPMLSAEPTDPAEPNDPIEPTDATDGSIRDSRLKGSSPPTTATIANELTLRVTPFLGRVPGCGPSVLEFRSAPLLASRGASTRA